MLTLLSWKSWKKRWRSFLKWLELNLVKFLLNFFILLAKFSKNEGTRWGLLKDEVCGILMVTKLLGMDCSRWRIAIGCWKDSCSFAICSNDWWERIRPSSALNRINCFQSLVFKIEKVCLNNIKMISEYT